MYNTLSTTSTHFKFNTSSLGKEYRTNDYTIVFQSLFLSTVRRLCLRHQLGLRHPELILMKFHCGQCTQKIEVKPIAYHPFYMSGTIVLPQTIQDKINIFEDIKVNREDKPIEELRKIVGHVMGGRICKSNIK